MIGLHTHTTYSFLDGYGTPEQYIRRLKEIGQTAMAITDHGNIYGHREFYSAFKKAGLKLLLGCEMYLEYGKKYAHITLIAENNTGYKNLCQLVSISNQPDHFKRKPIIKMSEIVEHKDGLIVMSGCFGTGIPHQEYEKDPENVVKELKKMKRKFKDKLYCEVQHISNREREVFRASAAMLGIPCVASIDTHYPNPEDSDAEDALFCIGMRQKMGSKTRYSLPPNLWLMSDKEALEFGYTKEEIDNTDKIGEMCDVDLPVLTPVSVDNGREKLIEMVKDGAKRLGASIKYDKYRLRYKYELSIIDKLGLHAYFVIMGQTINFFKKRGMFIGPARGSSAGSLICYLIGITEVDPIKYDLSFERFMDLNRKDYPDIDTDFPHDKRDSVVRYLKDTFGSDRVGRICSFTKYRGSSVFWDLCRIYNIDGSVAKAVGKAMPHFSNDLVDMKDMLEIPAIDNAVNKWPELKLCLPLENQIRNLGKHASGYAISPVDLSGVCAFNLANDEQVLSVDKNEAEKMGLLKLDILGLNTLDLIQETMQEVGIDNETLYRMNMTDGKVFEGFNKQSLSGIFQFEGGAVRRVMKDFTVESVEDLAFINAVARPGASLTLEQENTPPDCVKQFCYKGRYFVYQEELMAILRFLEFDWAEVTRFRKMVSKKKVSVLETEFKDKFIKQMSKMADESEAQRFWKIILRCGEYMFNKSHAISYSVLAYIGMYLKIYHRDSFVKNYLNRTSDDVKRRQMVREVVKRGGDWCIISRKSTDSFKVENGNIIGSLLAIKGIGPAKAAKIMATGVLPDKIMEKAINDPAKNAPWGAIDTFENRYPVADLPEGEYMVKARVWNAKDGRCIIEDETGITKAYYNERYTKMVDGQAYRLCITKYKYAKIDSAREL